MRHSRKDRLLTMVSALALTTASALFAAPAFADEAAAKKWIDSEFQPSTLSKDDQMKEMQWFIKAAAPFKGMDINVVSETITTHEYEAGTLAKAFTEITGIKVKHDLIQEGDVVEKLQTQMQSGKNVYDGWINDSDLIGTHFRYGQTVVLSDYMTGEGKDVTDPMLDVDDFIGIVLPPLQTAISTSCPTSSSPTSTGSATTGSTTRRTRPTSRPSTATTSAFRSTGRPMRTSPSSSPAAT